ASIILDDADFPAAVKGTVNACYLNAGQTCSAHTRMLVPQARYEEARALAKAAAEAYVAGDPRLDTTRLGALASAAQQQRVLAYIQRGIDDGAELVTGGTGLPDGIDKGFFVKPTVFGRVDPKSTIAQE
ncbi:aldehyde dehydrogenase family protein, partial [Burkholderia multivorans]